MEIRTLYKTEQFPITNLTKAHVYIIYLLFLFVIDASAPVKWCERQYRRQRGINEGNCKIVILCSKITSCIQRKNRIITNYYYYGGEQLAGQSRCRVVFWKNQQTMSGKAQNLLEWNETPRCGWKTEEDTRP